VPIDALAALDIRPADLAAIVHRSALRGWPDDVAELSG